MKVQRDRPIGVAILGSTGSIGCQALDVIEQSNGLFRAVALCADRNDAKLAEQIARHKPRFAALRDERAAGRLQKAWGSEIQIGVGDEALVEAASLDGVDIVLVSVVGFAGVQPTLAALKLGRRVALANKETLVVAGDLVMEQVRDRQSLLPVDSEHTAVFQTLEGKKMSTVSQVILTASGGPFRHTSLEELMRVGPEQALQHPTWSMGSKITIDSATLMNKGFEVIEAVRLFGLDLDQVSVVVHPQSLIHSLVEFQDGSILAQMAVADMRLSIAYALWYPEGVPRFIERLDLAQLGKLEFEPPDINRFPCLQLAIEACRTGGTMPAVLNAANEIAVAKFLEKRLGFMQIPQLIEGVLEKHETTAVTIESLIESDRWAREQAMQFVTASAR